MCGIVGMAGRLEYKHIQAFKDMLIVNQLRGRDSTGVIRVNNTGGDRWMKRVGPPEYLIETKEYDKEIEVHGAKILIGHGRAKTMGDAIHRNAHPFDHGDIVGVHNGTLRNWSGMERYRDFDVDSDCLYWNINEYGLRETISKLDNNGAWALVYWNRADGTLNFIRNAERPLYFAHSEDNKVMFWASEPWYFSTLTRKGITLAKDNNGASFYPLPIETHLSFKINGAATEPKDIFTLTVTKDVKGEVRSYTGNVHTNRGWTGSSASSFAHSGGSVPRPFDGTKSDLNDPLPNRLLPATTPTAGASSPILGLDGKPLSSSLPNTDSSKESNTGKSGQRPKLSLVSPSSSASQQASSESTSKRCDDCSESYEKPKVSVRQCVGIPFITDNKTKREFSEVVFDQATAGICTFCKAPIGDLTDVHEIFIRPSDRYNDEMMTFMCKTCADPNGAIIKVGQELKKALM